MMDSNQKKNTSHAWKGTWNRPMSLDEDSLDPLTVARMTDHNVRGGDSPEVEKREDEEIEPTPTGYIPTQGNPDDGGKLSPAEAERIQSDDFPSEKNGNQAA